MTTSSPSERVVFSNSFEGLLRAMGPNPSPEVLAAFRDHGVDIGRPLATAYPLSAYVGTLERLTRLRFGDAPAGEAYFAMGQAFLEGYGTTLMGKALLGMLRVLGPKRVLMTSTRNFRTANNYTETRVTELGDRHFQLWMYPVKYEGFYRGILTAGLRIAGAADVAVTVTSQQGEEVTYDIRWR